MARVDWNRLAPEYDAARGLSLEALEEWRIAVSPYLQRRTGVTILDLGCGTGRFAAAFARWFRATVIGLDPARNMLSEAIDKASRAEVAYLAGEGEHIPLREGSCDAAWLSTVIHHIHDLPACARELRRVLRPRSPVFVRSAFPGRLDDIPQFRFFPGARRIAETFPTVEETTETFAAAGFRMEALESVPQVSARSLREARDRVALRVDSTLAPLSDDEFARGLAALDEAILAETTPQPVVTRLDLLVLR